jgi:hypothetical protein
MTLIATIVRGAAKVTTATLVTDAMEAAQKTDIASVPFAASKALQKILRLQQWSRKMDDKTVQRRLNPLTRIINELADEAQHRYGEESSIYYEAEGPVHVMAHDRVGITFNRQDGIRFSSKGVSRADCGGW